MNHTRTAALVALNATVKTDRRAIAADDFFTGLFETALQPGELITAVTFPKPQPPEKPITFAEHVAPRLG